MTESAQKAEEVIALYDELEEARGNMFEVLDTDPRGVLRAVKAALESGELPEARTAIDVLNYVYGGESYQGNTYFNAVLAAVRHENEGIHGAGTRIARRHLFRHKAYERKLEKTLAQRAEAVGQSDEAEG